MVKWLAIAIAATGLTIAGCSTAQVAGADSGQIVLVAGATGGTGRALVRQLRDQGFQVRAFVRDEAKARTVLGDDLDYAVGDVRQLDTIVPAMNDADYVISAIGSSRTDPENNPEAVDFGGVKNLAAAAAETGVAQFVLVSSAGVTQEDHFLNKTFDNILQWKFKGEEALRASGVTYTIVRPGGLVNAPGARDLIVFEQGDSETGRISREDVAAICIAALRQPAARNRTFEAHSLEQPGSNDWAALFAALSPD